MHVCMISDPETVPKEKELAEKPAKELSSAKTVVQTVVLEAARDVIKNDTE